MKMKFALALVIVLAVAGGLAGIKTLQVKKMIAAGKAMVPPPETVASAVVTEEKWTASMTAVGSISAVQGVTITAELPGLVREIPFEAGAVVAKGAVLVRLDTATEEAQLRALEAQAELARLNLERSRTLRAEKTVSEAELDAAEATYKQTRANADAVRVTIEKKTVRAPFAGQLGVRQINLGQNLESGRPIVSLQSLDSVYADFGLPQQELSRLRPGMKVQVTTDAYPGQTFTGSLTVINPDLNASTRMVGLQATLPNPEQRLRPGMFARIEVLQPEEQTVLVIPATAVLSAPYGDSVYVIEPKPAAGDGKAGLVVRQQIVRLGRGRGDFLTVQSGLKAGEQVVSSGVFKLRNGASVVVNNALTPKADQTPRPADA